MRTGPGYSRPCIRQRMMKGVSRSGGKTTNGGGGITSTASELSDMGNTPEELAAAAEEDGAAGVGANCGIGPDVYLRVAQRFGAVTNLPLWIKPNAGLPQAGADSKTRYPVRPEEFASYVPQFIEAGVTFLGGCCGTTPAHILAARQALINNGEKIGRNQ